MKVINMNMLTLAILLLGFSITVFAETCKTYKPVDDFSIKKFAGDWYLGGVKIGSSKDSDSYSDMRCTRFNFFVDNEVTTSHNWTINLITRGKPTVLHGRYKMPDPTKGHLKLYFSPLNVTYNYFVLCTDYKTYSFNYACVHITPEEKSEYINIFVRDPKKYDEIVGKAENMKCLDELLSKKITEQLTKVPFDNCPNIR